MIVIYRARLYGSIRRNVKRFRGGLVFKAHRLVYHSTLGLRVIKKEKVGGAGPGGVERGAERARGTPAREQDAFISQFPHKSVNVSFIVTDAKNMLTNLCGN
jgi:hypothetical protein